MKKRLFYVFILFFLPFYVARAEMLLNEVMYDLKTGSDDGREWIEVYNSGENSIDFSKFKLFENDTNHKLVSFSGKEKIEPQSYVLIVANPQKFMLDHPNFSGNIFDSTFSLNNSGENLVLKDGEVVVDELKYNSILGGSGDGNSLQKIGGNWRSGAPTPGAENKIILVPKIPPKNINPVSNSPKILQKIEKNNEKENFPTENNISASVGENITQKNTSSYIFLIIFLILIIFSAFGIFFLRKSKISNKNDEDFEIFED